MDANVAVGSVRANAKVDEYLNAEKDLVIEGDSNGYCVIRDEASAEPVGVRSTNAREVFITEVLAANMERIKLELSKFRIVHTKESEDVVCLGDMFDDIVCNEKRLCFFGDGECLPINADSDEYNVIPDGPPQQWYKRYRFRDDLTPECKALREKAEKFYNEKQRVRSCVVVQTSEYDSIERVVKSECVGESESVSKMKAKWFNEVDKVMGKRKVVTRAASQAGACKKTNNFLSEVGVVRVLGAAVTCPIKRGRGRPPKQSGVSLIGQKRGRGRPPKHDCTPLLSQKRGRGRPPKQSDIVLSDGSVKVAHNVKKHAQPFDTVLAEFSASQLCSKCCKKVGQKLGQNVKDKVLQLEVVEQGMNSTAEVVKRVRGRSRKA